MDYKRNAKYFKVRPHLSAKAVLICLLLVVGAYFAMPLAAIGLLALFIGILYLMYGGRPTDAEIETAAASLFEGMRQKALKKLGVEEEEISIAPAIEFWSYHYGKTALAGVDYSKLQDVRGKDKEWRSPDVVMHGFYFAENEIQYYCRTASLVSDATREQTDFMSYKDVVSVKTDEDDFSLIDPKTGKPGNERVHRVFFMLCNTGGETTQCEVRNISDAEAAVNALRALVKQKKNA